MQSLGAVFGQKFGWERPNWFAPPGTPQQDHWSFRRSHWFAAVGEECRNVRDNVGLLDMTAFAKARVSGPGAAAFLNRLVANRLPRAGRVALCHALNSRGGVHSEFTIHRAAAQRFYLVSAGAFQRLDHDWLRRQMPSDGSVYFEDLTAAMGVLVVAGPKSRTLERVCDAPLANASFPWLTGRDASVGRAPAKLLRLNFVGELGYEIHHGIEYQNVIFDALMQAGQDLASPPSASVPWTRCASRSPTAWWARSYPSNMRRWNPAWIVSCALTKATSSAAVASWPGSSAASQTPSRRSKWTARQTPTRLATIRSMWARR